MAKAFHFAWKITKLGRWLGLVLVMALAPMCVVEKKPQPAPAQNDGNGELAPTDYAMSIFTDQSGDVVAEALREHEPTDEEVKILAAYWAYLSTGYVQGELATNFFAADLQRSVLAMAKNYPKFFAPKGANTGATSQALINSPKDFACDNSCVPGVTNLPATLLQALKSGTGLAGLEAAWPVTAALDKAFGVKDFVVDAADANEAIQKGLPLEAADKALQSVGGLVSTTTALAEAAAKVGGAALPFARVAGAVGLVITAYQIGHEIGEAEKLVVDCEGYKLENCAGKCEGMACGAGEECKLCQGVAGCFPSGTECCGGTACAAGEHCEYCPGMPQCLGPSQGQADCFDPCPIGSKFFMCGETKSCVKVAMSCCNGVPVQGSCDADAGADAGAGDASSGDGSSSNAGPKAVSWGDPHLETFDSALYDFQIVGELVLATDGADFVVQVRQQPYFGSTKIATNMAVAAKVAGHRVAFYAGEDPMVRIDGVPTQVSSSLTLPGGGTLAFSSGDYTLTWPDSSSARVHPSNQHLNLELSVAPSLAGKLTGLLGNFDGKAENDFVTRDGTPITAPSAKTLYGTFANSWRISQAESLFDYGPGQSTATFTDLSFPSAVVSSKSLNASQASNAQAACAQAGVSEPALLEACLLDVGMTGDASFAEEAAQIAAPSWVVHVSFLDFDSPMSVNGAWSGSCGGSVSGSFGMTIAPDGSVTGSYSGSSSGSLTGSASESGTLQASGSAGACSWSGDFSLVGSQISGSGTWDCGGGCSGTWSG